MTPFEKELEKILEHVYEGLQPIAGMELVKQAVSAHIIGEDSAHEPDVFKPRKVNDNPNAVILNSLRAIQRQALGDKHE